MLKKIFELIKEHDTIIIHRHSKPDGDALGSQIGLKHAIKDTFPSKSVYTVGDGAGRYSFMDDCVMDEIPDGLYRDALAIVLDTSASALISDDRYKLAKTSVRFDHHIFCEKIADYEHTDTTYESCAGLITAFLREFNFVVSEACAKALYTGMVTDSGRFKYDSVNSETFKNAAFLIERKFDTNQIYRNLYADNFDTLKLKAKFTLKVQFEKNNVAYIYTPLEEFESLGVDSFTISRGMVSVMADVKGVDTWVNFTETREGVLCEIRSSVYNINPIAVKYGGGGHAKASGATLKSRQEAMAMLADLVNLKENL